MVEDKLRLDPFYGDRSKLRVYLVQMKLAFRLYPNKYPDEASKVLYAATHLKGDAFAWFEPYMTDYLENDNSEGNEQEPDTIEVFDDFANFEEKIKLVFGLMDDERAAARRIHDLKQKGSAAKYYSQFKQLVAKLDWNDDAKHASFYHGLNDQVKEKMMPSPPEGFDQLVDEAIQIDNRLYELRMEKKGWYDAHGGRFRGAYQTKNHGRGDPMDIDAMENGKRSSRPKYRKPKRIQKDNERERYRRENLCYECGKPGHRARECKTPARSLHVMEKAGIEAKKADTSMKTSRSERRRQKAQKEPETGSGDGEIPPWMVTKIGTPSERPAIEEAVEMTEVIYDAFQAHEQNKKGPSDEVQKHALLSWTACYDDDCRIHYSEKEGSGWFPKKPRSWKRVKKQEIPTLTRENSEEALWWEKEAEKREQREAEQKRIDEENQKSFEDSPWYYSEDQESSKEAKDPNPEAELEGEVVIIKTTRKYVKLTTDRWERIECDCQQWDEPHTHLVYTPGSPKKRWLRILTLDLCWDPGCPYGDKKLHAHQKDPKERYTQIDLSDEDIQQIQDRWSHDELMEESEPDKLETELKELVEAHDPEVTTDGEEDWLELSKNVDGLDL